MKHKKHAALVFLLVSACGGFAVGWLGSRLAAGFDGISAGQSLVALGLGLLTGLYLHIILHEGGHLVCGLASGYEFLSFRVGSFVFVRQDGRIVLRRYRLAGTAGQCLLAPPPQGETGDYPTTLYNLGGVLSNLLFSLVFAVVSAACRSTHPRVALFFAMWTLVGCFLAVTNGLPLNAATPTDGANLLTLRRHPAAKHALWVQLAVNAAATRGQRLRTMPTAWFEPPEQLDDPLSAAVAVLHCNRLLDEGNIAEADAAMTALLASDAALAEVHRRVLASDLIFCKLLLGRGEEAEKLYDKSQRKFIQSMRTLPEIMRTEYAWALLGERDTKKAKSCLAAFETSAAKSPLPGSVAGERELIARIQECAAGQNDETNKNIGKT